MVESKQTLSHTQGIQPSYIRARRSGLVAAAISRATCASTPSAAAATDGRASPLPGSAACPSSLAAKLCSTPAAYRRRLSALPPPGPARSSRLPVRAPPPAVPEGAGVAWPLAGTPSSCSRPCRLKPCRACRAAASPAVCCASAWRLLGSAASACCVAASCSSCSRGGEEMQSVSDARSRSAAAWSRAV